MGAVLLYVQTWFCNTLIIILHIKILINKVSLMLLNILRTLLELYIETRYLFRKVWLFLQDLIYKTVWLGWKVFKKFSKAKLKPSVKNHSTLKWKQINMTRKISAYSVSYRCRKIIQKKNIRLDIFKQYIWFLCIDFCNNVKEQQVGDRRVTDRETCLTH